MAARQASRLCPRCLASPSAAAPSIMTRQQPWRLQDSHHLSSWTQSDLIRSLQQPGGEQTARSRPSQKQRSPHPPGDCRPQQPSDGNAQSLLTSLARNDGAEHADKDAADAPLRLQPSTRSVHRKQPQRVNTKSAVSAGPTKLHQPASSSVSALELQESVGRLLQTAKRPEQLTRIYGVGCDVAQIDRFRHLLCDPAVSSRFIAKMLHPEEVDAAADYVSDASQSISDPFTIVANATADEHLVQRLCLYVARSWAVKEAIVKASGQRLLYPQIILHKQGKKPHVRYTGKAGNFITSQHLTTHVSLSHDGGMVMAVVVLEQVPQAGATDQKLPQPMPNVVDDDARLQRATATLTER